MKDAKPRVAFIIQRYGEQMTGGAESHCRQIAERLVKRYDVEVLTTCATDHLSWKNALPEGRQILNGVTIRRFRSVGERKLLEFHKIYDRIFLTQLSAAEEYEMIRLQGPHTPDLIEYVRAHQRDYDAFIVYTYLYYTAVHTLPILKSKALFIPTAHDEIALYAHILDELFRQTPHLVFLSEEEQFLLQRRFSLPSSVGRVGGLGIDEPDSGEPDPAWEKLRQKLENRLVLSFVGRVENGKGCDELVDFFLKFVKEEARGDLTLLLLGRRTLPLAPHPQILSPGYVSEYVKFQALEMTDIGVAPSPFESLCMAALETWMHARPLLVNGRSPVLAGHCVRSNGGLWYTNYGEFREALKALLADRVRRMTLGAQGRAYVQSRYRWDVVESVYMEAIERVMAEAAGAEARNSG
jgi:glycosyltransferase involved in cell wall biosynthesis